MFGQTFKYQINPEKGTIKIRPTLVGTIKAFMPIWAVLGVLWVAGTYAEKKLAEDTPEEDPEK